MTGFLELGGLGPVVDSATKLTESLLGPGIRTRARQRELYAEDRFDQAATTRRLLVMQHEERAAENDALRRHRLVELKATLHRERYAETRYPLARPGRIRDVITHGLSPCLIVSPSEFANPVDPMIIAHYVADIINQVDESGQMVTVVSGGFAKDNGKPREIDGTVGSAEIALIEFSPRPSIVIRFDRGTSGCIAHALISDLFKTVNDENAFETPIARISGDRLEFATLPDEEGEPGLKIEWESRPVGAPDVDPQLAFATVIALFVLTISGVYWRLQGVRWRFERPSAKHINQMLTAADEIVDVDDEPILNERLINELAELRSVHADVEVLDADDHVAIYIGLPERAVTFIIDGNYPAIPPDILLREGTGSIESVRLDRSQWNPSRSLLDLTEALI